MGVNRTKQILLMKQHIESTWIDTDMGSGYKLILKDTDGSVIHEHKYLDIFELPEDIEEPTDAESQEWYDEWKENFKIESFEKFAGLCEVKWLYLFL
jgi:hypothetical protein